MLFESLAHFQPVCEFRHQVFEILRLAIVVMLDLACFGVILSVAGGQIVPVWLRDRLHALDLVELPEHLLANTINIRCIYLQQIGNQP